MSNIFNLLNINASTFTDFSLQAYLVGDHQTEKVINKNISRLKKIEENRLEDSGIKVPIESIDAVISKVKLYATNNNTSLEDWSIRELRIVSYYLMKLRGNNETYNFALNLLDRGWKNMFFNGLAFYLIDCWNKLELDYRKSTCNLIQKKLSEYRENNQRYLLMKDHANFFETAGPMRVAALVSAKQMNITDAPTIIGYKSSSISQSYYSEVILRYVENHRITDLDTIEKILELHNLDRTKKLLFAYLVENEGGNADRRIQLCRFVNQKLGDISIAATWAPFAGATNEEAQRLKRAMETVNIWFAQQIIETFFEICVQDRERKHFWLNYVTQIDGFRIVGSTATKRLLESNSRIGSMFLRLFIETNSSTAQTSALVMFMKDKMLVEFSDTGCLYVYNQTHHMVKMVTRQTKHIVSTNDLKTPSMQMLIEIYEWSNYYNEEGRVYHKGNWQERLAGWIQKKIKYSNATCHVLPNKNEEDLFQATPLPEESMASYDESPNPVEMNLFAESESKIISTQKPEPNQNYIPTEDDDSNEVVYESNVSFLIRSKVIFDNLEVVANTKGFYVTTTWRQKYALLKELNNGIHPDGNIWIKKTKMNDWCEIVHFYNGSERTIGFLIKVGENIYYKTALNEHQKKKINLK